MVKTSVKREVFIMAKQLHKRLSAEFVDEVLEAFNKQKITEKAACELIGIKRTRFYELRRQWLRSRVRGKEFLLWNRKDSNFHRFPEEVEVWLHKELKYIRTRADVYRGKFNFAFLAEMAEREFQRRFQRNSFRLFALRHEYYHCLPEEKDKVYTRFETSGPGVLYQHDSSHHLWLPRTRQRQVVIMTEDDHSRKVVGGRIVPSESTWDHLVLARSTVERYGRPLAYYVDNHSIFRYVQHMGVHYTYHKGPDEGEIQFKRALKALNIGLIYTGKGEAQAKGKIEKRFDYFQRRLPYLCEKHKIKKTEDAQVILDDLIDYYNNSREHEETGEIPSKKWDSAVKAGKGKLQPLDQSVDLDWAFSIHDTRKVRKDGTISYKGKEYKVGRFPGQEVTVCLLPGSKIMVYKAKDKLGEYHL
ncbi:MAG: hypothetical protein OEM19_04365 [Deltaproteobacteria bacterium]|nr:hypothetical protein [Deltaproteobacteria bacterium]